MSSVTATANSTLDDTWVFHPVTEVASAVISLAAYVGLLGWHAGTATFIAVLVHELGHWLALKHYGIKTRGILFLIVMAATPFDPSRKHNRYQDAMVSLAGPLTGVPLSIIYLLLYRTTGDIGYAVGVYITITLNVFNLIPIGRMDGGWVLANLHPSLRRNQSLMLAFMLTGIAAATITSMWSVFVGVLMAGFLVHKLLSDNSLPNTRIKKKRVMTGNEFSTVQALYAFGIIGMGFIMMFTGSSTDISNAYLQMIGTQLSGIWHAVMG